MSLDLSVTHMHTHTHIKGLINGCTVAGWSTGQGLLKASVFSLFCMFQRFLMVSKCSLVWM